MGTAEIGTAVPVSSARQAHGRGLEEVTDYQGQARRSPLEVQRGLRVEEIFHGVAIKPGNPVTFVTERT